MNWFHPANLGFAVRSKLADIGRGARLFARLMQLVGAAFARPGLVRDQVHFLGNYSLAIIAVSGLFVGFVLGLQGYYTLQRYGSSEALGEPLLYHAQVDSRTVRVALLEVDYGSEPARQRLRVQVAQSLTVRERIAQELLEQLLLPMGLMGLVLSALVYAGVLRGLQPLKRLEAQIERAGKRSHNAADPLPPIELTSAPQEVYSLASTINRLLEAVARGQQKEKRFLNDAAHQLRTPLAGLIGQTELALHESHEPQVRERLHKVLSAAQRSAHLVHQLLQLARSESNVPMQPLDLPQLACEVAREWTAKALAAGIDLGYEGEEQLRVLGHPLLLREALNNLIDNALHYAGTGATVTVRVHITAPGMAALAVEDDGPGVPAEHLGDLFARFWRGSDKAGGCGLGLSIVDEIALRHAGQTFAEPVVPHGLRVGISLPALP